MSHPQLSILIPAAGASKRLGQPKQLVRYKTGTLVQNAVDIALSIGPREVIVVTGAHKKAVQHAIQHSRVRLAHNSHWSDGMGNSIATGAAIISPESTGVMILLCDQWRLQTADLLHLTEVWQSAPDRIAVAEANGSLMPPAIFPLTCFNQLRELNGNQGARSVFGFHPELITAVPVTSAAFDLDTQDQLDELRRNP